MTGVRKAGGLLAVSALAALAVVAHAQPVYRCADADGGILYMDAPCRGGVRLDLAPGRADAAAIARLEREVERDAQRQAIRDAQAFERDLRRESLWQAPPIVVPGAPSESYAGGPWWYWGGAPAYVGPYGPPGIRPAPPPRPGSHSAPAVPARPANPTQIGR